MSIGQERRPKYYEGQYLGAADLEAAVTYARLREARHLLGAHTWGIAAGLQLQEVSPPGGGSGVNMFVRPGYAWDGFGRSIVVLTPYQIPPVLFQTFVYDPVNPNGVLVDLWLEYDESQTQPPRAGFELCSSDDQFSRVVETFRLEIGPTAPTDRRDPISVAGRVIDASMAYQSFDPNGGLLNDGSVPFQAFPDEGVPARWLIPLGKVRWQPSKTPGQSGSFAKRSDSDLTASQAQRVHIGAVAGYVLAADGSIVMKDRTRDYTAPPNNAQDLVQVQGALRAQGDIRLWGTQVSFLDQVGIDEGTPFAIRRTDNLITGTKSLDVQIGTGKGTGLNWFGVGRLNANTTGIDEVFVVLDNGNVGIGTTTPVLPLQVPEQGVQIGTSTTSTDNFYFASDTKNGPRGLRFYNQNAPKGVPLVTFEFDGKVGIGTTAPDRDLTVQGAAGTYLNVKGTSGGQPVEVLLGVDGAGGIVSTMTEHNLVLRTGNKPHMTILVDGKVGIGTGAPARKLHVIGDRVRLEGNGKTIDLRTDGLAVDVHSETSALYLRSSGPVNNNVLINPFPATDGFVGIGTDTPSDRLTVVGNAMLVGDLSVTGFARKSGNGSWTILSDVAMKQNIRPLDDALELLLRLRGVRFEWKDSKGIAGLTGPQTGLISQEVEGVFPSWVSKGPDGYKELTFRGFEALTVEAFRALQNQVTALQAQVQQLTQKIQGAGPADGPAAAKSGGAGSKLDEVDRP